MSGDIIDPAHVLQMIGTISGSGKVTLRDSKAGPGEPTPVDLELEKVLGDMPRKTYTFDRRQNTHQPLSLPAGTTAAAALDRVLRLPAVHSKRFLTTKVDRCVTGKSLRPVAGRQLQWLCMSYSQRV